MHARGAAVPDGRSARCLRHVSAFNCDDMTQVAGAVPAPGRMVSDSVLESHGSVQDGDVNAVGHAIQNGVVALREWNVHKLQLLE